MARRLEVELTSVREDGTWTWRAAGAKKPKGQLDGSPLSGGAKVGDVIKVEAEAFLDGMTITSVVKSRKERSEPDRLELIENSSGPLVTTHLAKKGRGRGRDEGGGGRDRDRGKGRGRGDSRDGENKGRGPRGDGKREGRGPRSDSDNRRPRRDDGGSRTRSGSRGGQTSGRERPDRDDSRNRPKRLKPSRTHRKAALAALPELQRQLADEVLKGGVPGVRQAVESMNGKATEAGLPNIKAEPLVALAERLLPSLKAAEWRDRADAALAGIDEIDLRDIRSVVVAAEAGARDDESRELADQLRAGLGGRVDREHSAWLAEIAATIADGRAVRALRLSSRPPKAGSPLPSDMASRLADAAAASLTADTSQDRWGTVLDAVAYSPVRGSVIPEGLPASPNEQLLGTVRKLASRVPHIATAFGIEAPTGKRPGRGKRPPAPVPPPPPVVTEPAAETLAPEAPAAEAPVPEAPAPEAPVAETPTAEADSTEL